MKVLLAGATGAIGTPLSRRLIAAGHQVIGLTRTQSGADRLTEAGVTPVIADALARHDLLHALKGVQADAVIHQLTSLTKPPARHGDMSQTNRLRTDGTDNLLAAARAIGAQKFLTQSIVFGYGYTHHGTQTLTETTPFGLDKHGKCAPHIAAMLSNEQQVLSATGLDGIALRYGLFYGADMQNMVTLLNKRRLPVPTRDNDLPWIHVEDAAAATVAALQSGRGGTAYNIVDDQACSWREMFTEMARTFNTPAPRTLPGWMIRAAAPYVAAMVLDTSMRVSNARAKAELDWHPAYPTYHDGLKALATR